MAVSSLIGWGSVAGSIVVAALFTTSGVQKINDRPAPYMTAGQIIYNRADNTVTQEHIVIGVPNMPAGWAARITSPDGQVLCEGGSAPLGSSYTNGKVSTFSPSVWTGDACPEGPLADGVRLWARWEYQVGGQTKATEAECIVGETCKEPQ